MPHLVLHFRVATCYKALWSFTESTHRCTQVDTHSCCWHHLAQNLQYPLCSSCCCTLLCWELFIVWNLTLSICSLSKEFPRGSMWGGGPWQLVLGRPGFYDLSQHHLVEGTKATAMPFHNFHRISREVMRKLRLQCLSSEERGRLQASHAISPGVIHCCRSTGLPVEQSCPQCISFWLQ